MMPTIRIHDEIEELEDAFAEYLTKEISGKREDEARDDTEKLTQTQDTILLNRDNKCKEGIWNTDIYPCSICEIPL